MGYYEYYQDMLEGNIYSLQTQGASVENVRGLLYYLGVDEKALEYYSFGNLFEEIYFNKGDHVNLSANELMYIQSNSTMFKTQYLYDDFGNQCDWVYIHLDNDIPSKDVTACALIKVISKVFFGLHSYIFQYEDAFAFGGNLSSVSLEKSYILSDWFGGTGLSSKLMEFHIENFSDENLEIQNLMYLRTICENSSLVSSSNGIWDFHEYDDIYNLEHIAMLDEVCGVYQIDNRKDGSISNDKPTYTMDKIYEDLKNVGTVQEDEFYLIEELEEFEPSEEPIQDVVESSTSVESPTIDESILNDPEALWNFFSE